MWGVASHDFFRRFQSPSRDEVFGNAGHESGDPFFPTFETQRPCRVDAVPPCVVAVLWHFLTEIALVLGDCDGQIREICLVDPELAPKLMGFRDYKFSGSRHWRLIPLEVVFDDHWPCVLGFNGGPQFGDD